MLLFTDRFSRRSDRYAAIANDLTAEGTASTFINRFIPLWRSPCSIPSNNGLQCCPKLSHAAYKLLGVQKIATSSHHLK